MLVATIVGILFLFQIFGSTLLASIVGLPTLFPIGLALMALTVAIGVPASYLIAIYRYRLYDLDLVVKKAVVFAVMVGVVIALYLLVAVVGARSSSDRAGAFAARRAPS